MGTAGRDRPPCASSPPTSPSAFSPRPSQGRRPRLGAACRRARRERRGTEQVSRGLQQSLNLRGLSFIGTRLQRAREPPTPCYAPSGRGVDSGSPPAGSRSLGAPRGSRLPRCRTARRSRRAAARWQGSRGAPGREGRCGTLLGRACPGRRSRSLGEDETSRIVLVVLGAARTIHPRNGRSNSGSEHPPATVDHADTADSRSVARSRLPFQVVRFDEVGESPRERLAPFPRTARAELLGCCACRTSSGSSGSETSGDT